MSTSGPLNDRSKKELAELARSRGVRGWDSMSKEDLVKAIARAAAKAKSVQKTAKLDAKAAGKVAVGKPGVKGDSKPSGKPGKSAMKPPGKPAEVTAAASPVLANGSHRAAPLTNGAATQKATPAKQPPAQAAAPPKSDATKSAAKASTPTAAPAKDATKDAPPPPKAPTGPTKDRIIMAVHDPYWLHVYWELSAASIQRAEAALKQDWYGARLILRLYDVTSVDTTSTSETPIRDIPIETDGSNWYINVHQPPRQYRVDLGYLSRRGILFVLARSNVVTPPKAGSSEAIDASWNMDTKKAERILAMSTGFESAGNPELREMFEERLKKSLGAPRETAFGTGATPPGSLKKFFFEIDAKLIVYGRTDPMAHLTLGNDPIKLNADGTFVMQFSLPDSRQIIPAVATSADGVEERTIVLAVERNTKYLDPMIHDQMNEI
jgi:hypothetical protein